jgi:hypothetical protein
MTLEEYAQAQQQVTAATAQYINTFSRFFVNPALTALEWIALLKLLFNEVDQRRKEAAELARTFYDSQRALHHPTAPRHDRFLVTYDFPTFVTQMDPARPRMTQQSSPKDAVTNMVMHAVREVENAGRDQIIQAVEADVELDVVQDAPAPEPAVKPEPKPRPIVEEIRSRIEQKVAEEVGTPAETPVQRTGPIRGWARVATGRETCSWCLMLISRGAIESRQYNSARGAGLQLDSATAARMIAAGEDVSKDMKKWHIGCDCKVVPVYDKYDWPGREASVRALELWKDASREAGQILRDNPDKKSFVKGEWIPTTHNREAINTLRRRLERGVISMKEVAAIAA